MSKRPLTLSKYVHVDFDVEPEEVLSSLSDDALIAECTRRDIATSVPTRLEPGGKPQPRTCHVIDSDDLDEALSLVGRGQRREALVILERALPRAFRDCFTAPAWGSA